LPIVVIETVDQKEKERDFLKQGEKMTFDTFEQNIRCDFENGFFE